jgi:hypothetical protein
MSQTKRALEYLREHPDATARDIAEAWQIPWRESLGTLVSRARQLLRDPEGVKARDKESRKWRNAGPKKVPGELCSNLAAGLLTDAIAAKFEHGMNWANTNKWHVAFVRPLEAFGGDVTAFNHPSNRRPVWNTQP